MYEWQTAWWSQYIVPWWRSERRPHAILINGDEGVGLLEFATAFASSVLCEKPIETAACGECYACRLLEAGTHPDLLQMMPEESHTIIGVDRARELSAWVSHTAHQGGYQVVILHPVSALNQAASNALLKILEEPVGDVLYLLLNPLCADVLPTIRSRTQVWTMPPVSLSQSVSHVQSVLSCSESEARTLSQCAGGAPLTAVLYAQEGYLALCEEMVSVLCSVADGRLNPLEVSKRWADYDMTRIVFLWMAEVRRCVAACVQSDREAHPLLEVGGVEVVLWSDLYRELERVWTIMQSGVAYQRGMLLDNLLLHWHDRLRCVVPKGV